MKKHRFKYSTHCEDCTNKVAEGKVLLRKNMDSTKKLTKLPVSEHQLQTEIMQYLRYKGFYVMRLNSGKYAMGEGPSKRFIVGQEAGTPDILCFREGFIHRGVTHAQMIFIEVKKSGNKPTILQTAKMQELEGYGAKCFVATSIEDVESQLQNI